MLFQVFKFSVFKNATTSLDDFRISDLQIAVKNRLNNGFNFDKFYSDEFATVDRLGSAGIIWYGKD